MRCELYYDADDVMEVDENKGFDALRIWALLSRVKQERGTEFSVVDVSTLSLKEMAKAYAAAVETAVCNRYRIRKVFGTNKASASFFGRGIPALLVYEDNRPVHVFPHEEVGGRVVTIREYLDAQVSESLRGEELARKMDESRKALGPVGISTSELIREGRRR